LAGILLAFVLAAPSAAEPFSSDTYGFSADFPAAPVIHPEQDAVRDANGRVVSRTVLVQAGTPHVYSAVVVVETFEGPLPEPPDRILTESRDACLKGWSMTITDSAPETLDGHKALLFHYVHTSGHGGGAGIVAVTEGEKPRVYILFTMATPKADDATLAALERMVGSFHIR